MIYLDATGGCRLPLQGGIPRVTRMIFRLLEQHRPGTLPVAWQPFRAGYTQLSPRARAMLDNRFELPAVGCAPRDSTGPLLTACLRDLVPWPAGVPLQRRVQAGDTLLLTSLFPDNRLGYLARLAGRPGRRVAVFHDAIPLVDPRVPAWEKARHRRLLAVLGQMDHVVSVSRASREALLRLWDGNGIAPCPVTVVPLPVDFDRPRAAFVTPPDARNILYVARLKEVKNHAVLFAACEILWREGREFSLTLIGCEDEAAESARIRGEIAQMRGAGRAVTWRVQVSEDELHAAYAASTFTAFVSRQEGFGLPIVESFWHGRPVLSSADGAMGEVSAGPGSVPVDMANPLALAAAMRSLLDDPARTRELAQAAYARPVRTWTDYWRDLEPLLA